MELLFKREQTGDATGRAKFKLWGKIETTEDELALIKRYELDAAVLIGADDSLLYPTATKLGGMVFALVTAMAWYFLSDFMLAFLSGAAAGIGTGYWYVNEKRETVFVRDLMHGRHFKCESVIELAKKEAWLEGASSVFRQVMESAKHWDGVEKHTIDPLPKEQAKQLILQAF
jgi:hypothetical protein